MDFAMFALMMSVIAIPMLTFLAVITVMAAVFFHAMLFLANHGTVVFVDPFLHASTMVTSGNHCSPTVRAIATVPILGSFQNGGIARDVTLVVVTVIHDIGKVAAVGESMQLLPAIHFAETREIVALIQRSDGVTDVIQLGIQSVLNLTEPNNQAQDQHGGDEHQLGGDNKASFVP
jgi:hypothetical protein